MASPFNQEPKHIRALSQAMDAGVRDAENSAQDYCVNSGGLTAILYLRAPFVTEIQKLAEDAYAKAVYAFRSPNLADPDAPPVAPTTTINPGGEDVLTAATVYPTSRPTVRYVLGDRMPFSAVIAELAPDVHCDVASTEHEGKLSRFKQMGSPDCIAGLADDAAKQKKVFDYYESELQLTGRSPFPEPSPISVGVLLPLAMGNGVVVVKLCLGHAMALVAKYDAEPEGCDIEEPWEGIGDRW